MTEDRSPDARTRAEDLAPPSRWERLRLWWQKWGDLVVAVVAITGAMIAILAAVLVYDLSRQRADDARVVRVVVQQQAANAAKVADTAKQTCIRTRKLGPKIADYYALDPKFPRDVLAYYRESIPKSCPK